MQLSKIKAPLKKTTGCIMALVIALTALIVPGCSTPEIAGKVDGVSFTSGEYLAYLYYSYSTAYNQYYLGYYEDPWSMTLDYATNGDETEKVSTEEYMVRLTKDTIARQVIIEKMMKEHGITVPQEKLDEFEKELKTISESNILKLGFNKSNYAKVFRKVLYNEEALFLGLFGKDGKTPMTDEEILKYYEENYFTYKLVSFSLVDDDEADLSEDEIKSIKDKLNAYLELYNGEYNKDFDKVIEKKAADDEAEAAEDDDEDDETGETTDPSATADPSATNAATTTEAAATTTEAAATTTEAATTTTAADAEDEDEDEDSGEPADPNLQFIDAEHANDEALLEAVKSVALGEVKIVEYKEAGTKKSIALIQRVDPKATEDYTLEKSTEDIIYRANYEDFSADVNKRAAELEITIDSAILKRCTPKQLEADMAKT